MSNPHSQEEIIVWCQQFIANTLAIDLSKINPAHEFESFGLDSVAAVSLAVELEEWLGRAVDPSLLFEYPSINLLASHLTAEKVAA
jgi:acyl carrier protein